MTGAEDSRVDELTRSDNQVHALEELQAHLEAEQAHLEAEQRKLRQELGRLYSELMAEFEKRWPPLKTLKVISSSASPPTHSRTTGQKSTD